MSRLPDSTSIFSVMSQMAAKHGAINLSQGFPDFDVDAKLAELVARNAEGNFHQYMPSAGYPPLLEKIVALIEARYGRTTDPSSEILVTAGATQAIFTSIQALVNPGEEIVILDPAYDCYDAPALLAGAKPVHVALLDDYSPDWEAIAASTGRNTKMLIINNPHNPSGRVWSDRDFALLEELLDKHPHVIVLSDEVYEHITYEQNHISVLTSARLRNRSISISSFGKSFHITGWKVGYAIAPPHLMKELKKVHQYLVFSVNSLAQASISDYIDIADIDGLGRFYKEKRDHFRNLLSDSKFELLPCEGSYFQVADYSNISDENDIQFTQRLARDFGVAAIPVSAFYAGGSNLRRIRFCFAKKNETLEKAAERLMKL